MKQKYKVCVYISNWEEIEKFNTYEDAKSYVQNAFKNKKMDYGIFYNECLIDETKP